MSPLWMLLLSVSPARAQDDWVVDERAVETYRRAGRALDASDPVLAEKLAQKALDRSDGDCAPCTATLAQALLLQNRSQEAYDLILPVLVDHPDVEGLASFASSAAFGARHFEDARNLGLQAITQSPREPGGWGALLLANMRLGDTDGARLLLARAERDLKADDLACLHGRLATEEERWDDVVLFADHCGDPQESRALLYTALSHRGNDPVLAEKLAAELDRHGSAGFERARQRFSDGQPEEALAILDQIEADGKADFDMDLFRVQVLERLERHEAALAKATELLAADDWVRVSEQGAMGGILTARTLRTFQAIKGQVAIWRVILLDAVGRPDEAQAAAASAGRVSGVPQATPASKAWLRMRAGDADGAWKLVASETEWLQSDVGEWFVERLALESEAQVPPDVYAALSPGVKASVDRWQAEVARVAAHNAEVERERAEIARQNEEIARHNEEVDRHNEEVARRKEEIARHNAAEKARVEARNARIDHFNVQIESMGRANAALNAAAESTRTNALEACLGSLDESTALLDQIDTTAGEGLDLPPDQDLAKGVSTHHQHIARIRLHCLVGLRRLDDARALVAAHPQAPYSMTDRWNLILLDQERAGPDATQQALTDLCTSLEPGDDKTRCEGMLQSGG
ncbi:MAG: hypothetical protein H6742_12325 [Alphaproteobacteria bacterium]|nr:hypothetical protein [Alphaproteobacteria bacterium]